MARTYLYHPSFPEGEVFDIKDKEDLSALLAKGWVDSPAKLGVKEEKKKETTKRRGRPRK